MSERKFSADSGHVGGLFLKFPVHLTRPVGRLVDALASIRSFLLDFPVLGASTLSSRADIACDGWGAGKTSQTDSLGQPSIA